MDGIPVGLPVPHLTRQPTATTAAIAWEAVERPNGEVLNFSTVLFRVDGCQVDAPSPTVPECTMVRCPAGQQACGLGCIDPQASVCCEGTAHERRADAVCCGASYAVLGADRLCCGGRVVPELSGFTCCGTEYAAAGDGEVCCDGVLGAGDACCGTSAYRLGPDTIDDVCCGGELFGDFGNRACCGGGSRTQCHDGARRPVCHPNWPASEPEPPSPSLSGCRHYGAGSQRLLRRYCPRPARWLCLLRHGVRRRELDNMLSKRWPSARPQHTDAGWRFGVLRVGDLRHPQVGLCRPR